MGHLLHQQRPVIRDAHRGERRDLFEHRYRSKRWLPHGNASGVQCERERRIGSGTGPDTAAAGPAPPPPAPPPPPPPAAPPPVISGSPPTSVQAGSSYAFQPTASDPGGLTLAFSVQNKPAWATFSIVNGSLSGTPSSSQAGTYSNVVISASDGQQASALPAFSINVTAPPPITGTALLDLTVPTRNTDGSALTDLAGVRIYYGTSSTNLTQVVQLASATVSSYTVK